MSDLEHLVESFANVVDNASLREIETMLRVLGAGLELRFHDASVHAYQAAEELSAYRRGKGARKISPA